MTIHMRAGPYLCVPSIVSETVLALASLVIKQIPLCSV
jgi:hypothetical protein